MPSLGQHMGRAREIARILDHPAIEADRGAYYLGATAPDIRVITRRDRRVTHFYDLAEFGPQDSVGTMLAENPDLRAQVLEPRTRAFVAGYVTHLILDEVYIETVYRQYFGERSAMAGDAFANVLDRALQFEMNRRELADGEAMTEIEGALQGCETSNRVRFIEDDSLAQWRGVVLDFAGQGPTWDRFPRMMSVHLRRAGLSDEEIDRYGQHGPELARRSLEYVTEARIEHFVLEATRQAASRAQAYLDGSVETSPVERAG